MLLQFWKYTTNILKLKLLILTFCILFQIPELSCMKVLTVPGNQNNDNKNQSPVQRLITKVTSNSNSSETRNKKTTGQDKTQEIVTSPIARFITQEKTKITKNQDNSPDISRGPKAYKCHICGTGGPEYTYSKMLRHIAFSHYRDKLHALFGDSNDKCSKCEQIFTKEQVGKTIL